MKYKEFRMLIFTTIFFIIIVIASVLAGMNHNSTKMIIGLVLSFILLMLILTRYSFKLFGDGVMIYQFKGIGMLPAFIDYSDIKEIKLLSNHKLQISHKSVSTLYILDAQAFYQDLQNHLEEYKKAVNQED